MCGWGALDLGGSTVDLGGLFGCWGRRGGDAVGVQVVVVVVAKA